MGLFGVSANSIVRSIMTENTSKLERQTRSLSKKESSEVERVVMNALDSLQSDLSSRKVQSITLGFLADLSSEDHDLIGKVFNENVFTQDSVKEAFTLALKDGLGERAIKLLISFPNLIFEKVNGHRVFKVLTDEAKARLVRSGAISPQFLMEALRNIKNG